MYSPRSSCIVNTLNIVVYANRLVLLEPSQTIGWFYWKFPKSILQYCECHALYRIFLPSTIDLRNVVLQDLRCLQPYYFRKVVVEVVLQSNSYLGHRLLVQQVLHHVQSREVEHPRGKRELMW